MALDVLVKTTDKKSNCEDSPIIHFSSIRFIIVTIFKNLSIVLGESHAFF